MTTRLLKQWIFILLAGTSLIAAPLTACACSHHQQEVNEEVVSCHGKEESVAIPAAERSTDEHSVDEGCVCYVSPPTVAVKAEKRNNDSDTVAETVEINDVLPGIAPVRYLAQVPVTFNQPIYKSAALRGLLPARAPPRL